MRYELQTLFGKAEAPPNERGNCLQATVASLLGVPLIDVPHFVAVEGDWWSPLQEWLRGRGYQAVSVPNEAVFEPPMVMHIATGWSPRGLLHSVIYHGDELEHDPHPEGGGLKEVVRRIFLIPVSITEPERTERCWTCLGATLVKRYDYDATRYTEPIYDPCPACSQGTPERCETCGAIGGSGKLRIAWVQGEGKASEVEERPCLDCMPQEDKKLLQSMLGVCETCSGSGIEIRNYGKLERVPCPACSQGTEAQK